MKGHGKKPERPEGIVIIELTQTEARDLLNIASYDITIPVALDANQAPPYRIPRDLTKRILQELRIALSNGITEAHQ